MMIPLPPGHLLPLRLGLWVAWAHLALANAELIFKRIPCMKTTFFPAFSRRMDAAAIKPPLHLPMGDRKALKSTEWASWIGVFTPIVSAGVACLFMLSQKSSDVEHLKEGQAEQKATTQEVRRDVSDMKGDIKAVKVLLERLELEQKRP